MSETFDIPKIERSSGVEDKTPLIEQKGLQDYVINLYTNGASTREISRKLLEEKNVKLSSVSVANWIKKSKLDIQKSIQRDVKTSSALTKLCTNYEKEIKDILDEVKQMKNQARDEKDIDNYQKLVGRLYQGLELLAKLMGDIKPSGAIDVNVIINKLSEELAEENKNKRYELFSNKVIDIDADIEEEDLERERQLKGE